MNLQGSVTLRRPLILLGRRMSSHRLLHRPSSAWSASPGARSRDTSREERSLDGSPLRAPPMSTSRRSLLSSSPRRGASSADVATPLALGSDATSSTGRFRRGRRISLVSSTTRSRTRCLASGAARMFGPPIICNGTLRWTTTMLERRRPRADCERADRAREPQGNGVRTASFFVTDSSQSSQSTRRSLHNSSVPPRDFHSSLQ